MEEDQCHEHPLGALGASVNSSADMLQQPGRFITTSTTSLEWSMHQTELKKESSAGVNALLTEIKNKVNQLAGLESRLPTQSFMETVAGHLVAQTNALDSLCYAVEQLRADNVLSRRYSKVSHKRASPNLGSVLEPNVLSPPGIVPTRQEDAPALLAGSSSSYSKHSKHSVSFEKFSMERTSGDRGLLGSAQLKGKPRASDASAPRGVKKPESRAQSLASSNDFSVNKMSASAYGMMDELEAFTAQQLMQKRKKATEGEPSRSVDVEEEDQEEANQDVSPRSARAGGDGSPTIIGKARTATLKGAKDKADMLKNCRRMSLDELRENYDAVMARMSADNCATPKAKELSVPTLTGAYESALGCIPWILLCVVGIMDFGEARCWRILARWAYGAHPIILVALLVYSSSLGVVDSYDTEASCFFFAGAVLATFSLRRCNLQSMIDGEDSLNDYAFKTGFLKDWRRLSKRRMTEVFLLYAQMIACRVATTMLRDSSPWEGIDVVAHLVIAFMELQFTMVAFAQLHVCCGLELAIDNFGFRFFKEMDLEEALDEWNTLQATLRQVSGRLSGSILMLGLSCLGPMVLLAERALRNPDFVQTSLDTAFWIAWLYPPILQFLYMIARAASVTGRASRVAPLVNSWKFESQSDEEAESGMDQGRQYVVQYIIQSEAGFYMKGVRISASDVQKMGYYLLAFTFGLASRFF